MRYIICDESEKFVRQLKESILKIEPNSTFAIYSSLSELRPNIEYVAGSSDAVFLDIRLDNGDGTEAAKEIFLKYPHLKLIYVTDWSGGSPRLIFENSVEMNPAAFLTKPIQEEYLANVLKKIKEPIRETRFITVRANRSIIPVPTEKVLYISSDKRRLTLHMTEEDISFYGKLSDMLGSDIFLQIHKSYAVNLRHIGAINGWKTVTLSDGTELPIGRTFSAGFRADITGRSVNGRV